MQWEDFSKIIQETATEKLDELDASLRKSIMLDAPPPLISFMSKEQHASILDTPEPSSVFDEKKQN